MNNVSLKEIKDAYIKLKSYVYYENFSIGLKAKLAKFESNNLDKKLTSIVDDLKDFGNRRTKIERDIENLNYYITPKKFKDEIVTQGTGFYFSNQNKKSSHEIDSITKVTAFIDCSIELHIVTILWIKRIGRNLDSKLGYECYGNRLIKHKKAADTSVINHEIKLFNRYYLSYNKWRDTAIKSAKRIYKQGKDAAILNLDIQSYFNSVDFDLTILTIKKKDRWLNELLSKLHERYSEKLYTDGLIKFKRRILPIGLISSNILANFYLVSFDGLVLKTVRPAFYGRYVDDIILVFSAPLINKKSPHFLTDFIEQQLAKSFSKKINGVKHRCEVARLDDNNFSISINSNELKFQLAKVKLYHLHKEESINVLEGFEREIRKNSSEFKFQLETDDLIESFEESSYDIIYGDTVNKLRSIEKFNANKFGASKHLARLINGTKDTSKIEKKKLNKVSEKILTFFSGKRALELVSLWDKVFTFFVLNNQQTSLITFSKHLLNLIITTKITDPHLSAEQNEKLNDRLIDGLFHQMILSYAMAAALDISFFNAKVIKRLKSNLSDSVDALLSDLTERNIIRLAKQLIQANLFRQQYIPFPLLNYCTQKPGFSFNSQKIPATTSFIFNKKKIEYSPRFINFNEVELFYYLQFTFLGKKISKGYFDNRIDFVFKRYMSLNKTKPSAFQRRNYPKIIGNGINPQSYTFTNEEELKWIRIGIVNINVDETLTFKSLQGKPALNFERLDTLHQVLNEAIRTKCHLVVFPEISVPFQWLPRLTEFCKKNDIGIICGVEHFSNSKKEAFNYVATILPFENGLYKNSFLDLRLKIDYAPVEGKILKEKGYKIPAATKSEILRVYHWKNVSFSVLNCFELTDINKRIKFKGEVDFLATIEYNRDIPYFSSINESLSRDLHCFVIQVNTSHYGDSRITFPSDSFRRDHIKLKGGENISLVTGVIRVNELREFQRKSLSNSKIPKHLEDKFKPLPPNFEISKYRQP